MELCRKSDLFAYQDEVLSELYNTNTLVNAMRICCQSKEFSGEYYGIPEDYIPMISNERNEYIYMLTLISDKINHIEKISTVS